MRKVYYIYNPQTQTYDRIYPTVRQRALSILRRLFIGMGLGAGSFIVLLLIFGSPSEKELRKENSKLQAQYNVLSRRLDEAMGVLQDIQQRDDNLYRVIFMSEFSNWNLFRLVRLISQTPADRGCDEILLYLFPKSGDANIRAYSSYLFLPPNPVHDQ